MSGRVKGDISLLDVNLNGLPIKNQCVGLANEINIPILEDVAWDGIVGLAFANNKLKKQEITPIFDTIMRNFLNLEQNTLKKENLPNIFSYYIGEEGGSIIFGGYDTKFMLKPHQPIFWIPLLEHYYWTIPLIDIRKDSLTYDQHINYSLKDEPIKLCP
jgi:hypothetical protein